MTLTIKPVPTGRSHAPHVVIFTFTSDAFRKGHGDRKPVPSSGAVFMMKRAGRCIVACRRRNSPFVELSSIFAMLRQP
jgi:hypothetical protein